MALAAATMSGVCVMCIHFEKDNENYERKLNDISNRLKLLEQEVEDQKIAREGFYENRIKELELKVKELEAANYTTIVEADILDIEDDTDPLSVYCSKDVITEYDTNTYRCMDYRTLTNHRSDQWLLQLECYSDPETGIRCYICDDEVYYCAALGSAYTETIGDSFRITLQNGYSFNVINGDFKVPLGTPDFYGFQDRNYDGEITISIVEFIFDQDVAPKKVLQTGTMSALEQFGGLFGDGGNITDIYYTGRVWEA